ncbi:MAG TPA: hypothetical protein VKU60_04930, partial [Chloroflexota bacterium]|nr:hypothetical protein [Chloroflexota bacterium]
GTEQGAETQALAAEQTGATQAAAGFQPYLSTGAGATYSLAELYGLPTPSNPAGGEPLSDASLQAFQRSPDYQFALQQGIQAENASAAAKGGAISGGAAKELETFGSGLASQNLNSYLQRLQALSAQGESAAGSVGNIYEQLAGQQAGTISNAGSQIATTQLAGSDAAARATLGAAGARATGITSAAGAQAVGLTGASSAYANAVEQAANINSAGTAGAYADISSGVTNAFNNAAFQNYLSSNGAGASAYGTGAPAK